MAIDPDRVQAVFLAAAACGAPGERAVVLERECGDDVELRRRVDALLKAHDDSGELPPIELATLHDDGDRSAVYVAGTVIAGRYRLSEEIATGGMGSVWVAQQIEPVQRQVALKLIKPGMGSRGMLSRFEVERQALALMDHSHIARVFDGGLTDEGRPFFVMEYVQGLAITDYCDQARLTITERVALLIQVCRAVHHAHQKGIIHRDLKPSNVLVARDGDQPVPKVIDFGLAKATHDPLTEDALASTSGLIMGTPRYMSPEQADRDNLDIDTRADVYSLGVILYELLTGATPLGAERFKQVAVPELLKLTQQADPSWPSSRLVSGDSLATIAAARGAEPHRLQRAVRGDLDWIVMKALEKDRSRRYESANDLARDLERYLRDDPVAARPRSTVYRLRKFARRQRLALSAIVLVAGTLIAGTIVSATLAVRATRAMRQAEAARIDEAVQREIAQNERNDAERRRAQAELNFRKARHAMDTYFVSLRANKSLNVPELQPLRKELLGVALADYRQLIDLHGDDPGLRAELANAYFRVGELSNAIGSNEQALAALRESTRRYDQLVQEHGDIAEYWWPAARPYEQLGLLQQAAGHSAEAESAFRRVVELHEKVARAEPADLDAKCRVSRAYIKLGNLQTVVRQFAAAEISLRRALEIQEALVAEAPNESVYRTDLADAHYFIAMLQRKTGRLVDAEASYLRAVQIYEQLRSEYPNERTYLFGSAGDYYKLGHVKRIAGQPAAARALYVRALALYEAMAHDDPSSRFYRRLIGGIKFHLGLLDSTAGRQDEATQRWTDALKDFRAASELGFESTGFVASQADVLAKLGRWAEAADVLTRSHKPDDNLWQPRCQIALLRWADGNARGYRDACRELLGRCAKPMLPADAWVVALACLVDPVAVDDWNPVLEIARQAAAVEPTNPVYVTMVGAAQFRAGHFEDARQSLERSAPLYGVVPQFESPLFDPLRAGQILRETMFLLVHNQRNDRDAVDQQRSLLQELVNTTKATAPVYCDTDENWQVGFALIFAERELARRAPPAER